MTSGGPVSSMYAARMNASLLGDLAHPGDSVIHCRRQGNGLVFRSEGGPEPVLHRDR